MTEPVRSGLAVLPGIHDIPRGSKGGHSEGKAFGDALDAAVSHLPRGEDAPEMASDMEPKWHLADRFPEITLPWQRGDGSPDSKDGDGRRKEEGAKQDVIAFLAQTTTGEVTVPAGSDPEAPGKDASGQVAIEKTAEPQPATTDALSRPAKAEPENPRSSFSGLARGETAADSPGSPERSREHPLKSSETAAVATSASGDADPAQPRVRPAVAPGLARQHSGPREQPAGRRDADSSSPPVRVVSVQSAPAPASAPPAGATAAALVSDLGQNAAFAAAAAEAARIATQAHPRGPEPLHTLKIQLQPAELGMVTARLSVSGDQLTVELQVDSPEARHRLETDRESMAKALRAMGYDVDRITIQQTPNTANGSTGGAATGRQSGFQAGPGHGQQGGGQMREGGQDSRPHPGGGRAEGRHDAEMGSGLYI